MIITIVILVSIIALSLLLTYLLGLIETMILTTSTILGTVVYLIVKCRTLANKCFDTNKQLILPLKEYYNLMQPIAPASGVSNPSLANTLLKKLISFQHPFIYNIIGLLLGVIGIVIYKRDIQSDLDDKDQSKEDLITRLKIAKKDDNRKRQIILQEIIKKEQKQCNNKIQKYKDDEEERKATIREKIKKNLSSS